MIVLLNILILTLIVLLVQANIYLAIRIFSKETIKKIKSKLPSLSKTTFEEPKEDEASLLSAKQLIGEDLTRITFNAKE